MGQKDLSHVPPVILRSLQQGPPLAETPPGSHRKVQSFPKRVLWEPERETGPGTRTESTQRQTHVFLLHQLLMVPLGLGRLGPRGPGDRRVIVWRRQRQGNRRQELRVEKWMLCGLRQVPFPLWAHAPSEATDKQVISPDDQESPGWGLRSQ